MSSSTSSSRPLFARVFLVGLLCMAASLGLVRGFTRLNDASGDTILGRPGEARDALPKIFAEPQPLMLVYGSSMVEAGFSPRQFDREVKARGGDVKSFNFGFGGLNPFFQDYFARRIRDEAVARNRRFELTLIEFNPFQTTQTRWQGSLPIVDSMLSILATPAELWEITRRDPTRGVRIANIRYLRDNISAELVTSFLSEPFEEPPVESATPEDEALVKRREELEGLIEKRFEQDYPNYVESEWSWEWQGAGTIPEERPAESVALIQEFITTQRTQRRLENDKLFRIRSADVEGLRFEEELVAAFIRTVVTLKEVSNQVEIILLPRNTAWIHYSPETETRLAALLERLTRETGVPVRNYQVTDRVGPEMFRDTTHLGRYTGDVAFTQLLAEGYGPRLGANLEVQ